MIVRGKNVGRINEKKFDKAVRMMQRDYIYNTKHSNMYLVMTKEEERKWEVDTIADYNRNYTSAQLDEMINNKLVELDLR
jgi:hypothetical protein